MTRRRLLLAGFAALSLVAAAIWAGQSGGGDLAGVARGKDGSVVLLPEKWLGAHLPIMADIDVGDRLASGSWSLVFVRNGCKVCAEEVPALVERARQQAGVDEERIALVEVGGRGPEFGPIEPCVPARLSPDRRWFVRLPTEVRLRDGVVIEVRSHGAKG